MAGRRHLSHVDTPLFADLILDTLVWPDCAGAHLDYTDRGDGFWRTLHATMVGFGDPDTEHYTEHLAHPHKEY